MPDLSLATFASRRAGLLTPAIRLLNLITEPSPSNLKTQVDLFTRPNLERFCNVGLGPIRCIYQKADAFGGDALVVSGTTLYRVTQGAVATVVGTVAGTGIVQIDSSAVLAKIATGGPLLSTDGVTVTTDVFPAVAPDNLNCNSVAYINGYFLANPVDSHRIYYWDILTGLWDATRVIPAERYPDNIVDLITTSDELWAIGKDSTEVFVPTGVDTSDQPPFQRVEGRLYKKGCIAKETVVEADNTVFWVGRSEDSGLEVYRAADVPEVISTPSISERLALAVDNDLSAWSFGSVGHLYLVVALGSQGTQVYDISQKRWLEWTSYGRDQWRAWLGRGCWPGMVIAGDDEDGVLWRLSENGLSDDGTEIQQVWTAGAPLNSRTGVASLQLDASVGQGAGAVMLRYSRDQGRTWQQHNDIDLIAGRYTQPLRWRRLGTFNPPGMIFEWEVTDPVRMRVSACRVNEGR